jgi:hypothetical protein
MRHYKLILGWHKEYPHSLRRLLTGVVRMTEFADTPVLTTVVVVAAPVARAKELAAVVRPLFQISKFALNIVVNHCSPTFG